MFIILIKLVLTFLVIAIGGVFFQVVDPVIKVIIALVMLGLLRGIWKYKSNKEESTSNP